MSATPERRSGRSVSRRTALEWLTAGTVLALTPALAAVSRARARERLRSGAAFPFRPGERAGAPFDEWPVRTVDPQELTAILGAWQLRVDGLVEHAVTYPFADLLGLPRTDQVSDLHCVEGWSVYDIPWHGVRLADLLDRARPLAGAAYVNLHTWGDRYNDSLPLATAREPKSLLAYGAGDSTLPLPHGFPLRVVVPRLLGYKNAKYVYRVELAEEPLRGYWVAAGYPYEGEVPPERLRPEKH